MMTPILSQSIRETHGLSGSGKMKNSKVLTKHLVGGCYACLKHLKTGKELAGTGFWGKIRDGIVKGAKAVYKYTPKVVNTIGKIVKTARPIIEDTTKIIGSVAKVAPLFI